MIRPFAVRVRALCERAGLIRPAPIDPLEEAAMRRLLRWTYQTETAAPGLRPGTAEAATPRERTTAMTIMHAHELRPGQVITRNPDRPGHTVRDVITTTERIVTDRRGRRAVEIRVRYEAEQNRDHEQGIAVWPLDAKVGVEVAPSGAAAQTVLTKPGDTAPVYPEPGSSIPGMPGYVVAECGHRVAGSEWRAGFSTCERCPAEDEDEDGTE